jgi:hypothetical protein
MDINKYISKKVLIYICIIIVVLIALRILYSTFYINIENFEINNENAVDLLNKIKSGSAQNGINLNSSDLEMQIFSWSNYIYNLNNSENGIKPISFYKPILTIDNNIYSKLGDIVSTNADYSPPSNTQFTLLIKKNTSDIKPPVNFDLVVNTNTNNRNTNRNSNYLKYINGMDSNILNNITNNLSLCSAAISNLNTIIRNNTRQINSNLISSIYTNALITVDSNNTTLLSFLNIVDPSNTENIRNSASASTCKLQSIESFANGFGDGYYSGMDFEAYVPKDTTNKSTIKDHFDFLPDFDTSIPTTTTQPPNPYYNPLNVHYDINPNSNINLPAGIQGYISYSNINNVDTYVDISIPANLDSYDNKYIVINNLPSIYNKLKVDNIIINRYPNESQSIFLDIPLIDILNYIKTLCTEIQNIYNQPSVSSLLLSNLKLAANYDILNSILLTTDTYLDNPNISSLTVDDFINDLPNAITKFKADANIDINDTSNLLGLVIYIIKNMKLTYKLTSLNFKPSDIGITTNMMSPNSKLQITITKFNNDISSNIPSCKYNILNKNEYKAFADNLLPNIRSFLNFIKQIIGSDNNSLLPICIYNPVAPEGYVSLGHVFCNSISELQTIIQAENIACVPSHCVKEMRDWILTDKIFEYNSNNVYWAIYSNPYTGTFISSTIKGTLPPGKVCKVVACVAKNNTVETLKKADDCIRQYYNINKQATMNSPMSSKLVSDQEEIFYLDKIKSQSDSITRLQQRSKQMQTDIDKATIINREMNKNKLQDYTDTQKRNMNLIMEKLKDDKNKIQTNINLPLNTLNEIINMLNNLPPEQQNTVINLLDSNNIITKPQMNKIINSCPQYDLSGLVTKQMASDVCYGCDNPM